MVAVLAGLVVFLLLMLIGAWATIEAKNERIAELEAIHVPTAPPVPVFRERSSVPERDTLVDLPKLFDLEGNDEPTLQSVRR
jgi:hypothetical protein